MCLGGFLWPLLVAGPRPSCMCDQRGLSRGRCQHPWGSASTPEPPAGTRRAPAPPPGSAQGPAPGYTGHYRKIERDTTKRQRRNRTCACILLHRELGPCPVPAMAPCRGLVDVLRRYADVQRRANACTCILVPICAHANGRWGFAAALIWTPPCGGFGAWGRSGLPLPPAGPKGLDWLRNGCLGATGMASLICCAMHG